MADIRVKHVAEPHRRNESILRVTEQSLKHEYLDITPSSTKHDVKPLDESSRTIDDDIIIRQSSDKSLITSKPCSPDLDAQHKAAIDETIEKLIRANCLDEKDFTATQTFNESKQNEDSAPKALPSEKITRSEELIIDGFAISAFETWEDLQDEVNELIAVQKMTETQNNVVPIARVARKINKNRTKKAPKANSDMSSNSNANPPTRVEKPPRKRPKKSTQEKSSPPCKTPTTSKEKPKPRKDLTQASSSSKANLEKSLGEPSALKLERHDLKQPQVCKTSDYNQNNSAYRHESSCSSVSTGALPNKAPSISTYPTYHNDPQYTRLQNNNNQPAYQYPYQHHYPYPSNAIGSTANVPHEQEKNYNYKPPYPTNQQYAPATTLSNLTRTPSTPAQSIPNNFNYSQYYSQNPSPYSYNSPVPYPYNFQTPYPRHPQYLSQQAGYNQSYSPGHFYHHPYHSQYPPYPAIGPSNQQHTVQTPYPLPVSQASTNQYYQQSYNQAGYHPAYGYPPYMVNDTTANRQHPNIIPPPSTLPPQGQAPYPTATVMKSQGKTAPNPQALNRFGHQTSPFSQPYPLDNSATNYTNFMRYMPSENVRRGLI